MTEKLSMTDVLTQLSFAVQAKLEHRAAGQGITLAQGRLLGILRDREPTMQELADYLELDKSSITGLVNRAEKKKYVTKKPSETDKRSYVVAITPEGKKLIDNAAEIFEHDIAELVEPLKSREQDKLQHLVSRIVLSQRNI